MVQNVIILYITYRDGDGKPLAQYSFTSYPISKFHYYLKTNFAKCHKGSKYLYIYHIYIIFYNKFLYSLTRWDACNS